MTPFYTETSTKKKQQINEKYLRVPKNVYFYEIKNDKDTFHSLEKDNFF